MDNYIISYPRSGNHFVRFIVEYLSGRPTLGCSKNDVPIYMNDFGEYNPINIIDKSPIFKKSHSSVNSNGKLILILRNYKECLLRHNNGNVKLSDVDGYFKLIQCFNSHKGDKIIISYNDLINDVDKVVKQISNFLSTFDRVGDFIENKNNLISLSKNAKKRAWAGSVSGDDLRYHQKRYNFDWSNIDDYIIKKYDNILEEYEMYFT